MCTTCFGVRLQCRPDKDRFYVPPVAVKFVPSHIVCHIAAGFMPSSFVWISQLVLYCSLHCSCNRCLLLWNCKVFENCLDWNVTNVMQIECYKSRRNKTLIHNFEQYRLVTIFTFWIISFKLCPFLCHVLRKALSIQIQQCSCKFHHVLPTVGIENCLGWFPWTLKIMVLLKHVGNFHFALKSHTTTDSGPTDVSPRTSSLKIQVKFSFCAPWSYVAQWSTAPLIHNFDTRRKLVVNCTLATWPKLRISRCLLERRLAVSALDCTFRGKENICNFG
jgi:hypothetical protein